MKYIFRCLAYKFIVLKQMSVLSWCRFLWLHQKLQLLSTSYTIILKLPQLPKINASIDQMGIVAK